MTQKDMMARVTAIQAKYADELMGKPYVVGLAVGLAKKDEQYTDQIALVVMVSRKVPDDLLLPEDRIPTELDGIPVDVQEVGDITAY